MTESPIANDQLDPETLKAFALEHCLITNDQDLDPEVFPELTSLSPRFFFRFLVVPEQPTTNHPEYVYVKRAEEYGLMDDDLWRYRIFTNLWNNT